jgi:DNA processing protein
LTDVLDHLTLHLLPGLNPRLSQRLCARAPLPDILSRPREHEDLLPPDAVRLLLSGGARAQAEKELEEAERREFRICALQDPDYPPLLRATHDPPLVLYVWGTLRPGEGQQSLAIVGARAATPAGLALARSLGRDLGQAGLVIVSGLARGVDAAAHLGALDGGGRTVAVLGSGLGRLYPEENAALAERITFSGGAVVSEFSLDTPPYKGHFPRRNRIIAGWGAAVVVVEAGQRSGALVTARLALDEGRDVYAVPGHPFQETAAGTNQLIRDGAPLVRAAPDVLAELGIECPVRSGGEREGDDTPLRFLSRDNPASLDDLATRSGLCISVLLERLTELELAGRVRRVPGALYVRN